MKQLKIISSLAIIIVVLFSLIKVYKIQDIVLKKIYPIKYEQYIEEYSKEYKLDKWLIYAIIKAESNFDEIAKSNSGAIGLMQIMETTADELKKSLNINETIDLCDAKTNIMLGTKYFSDLKKEYNNLELALAAYNAGKGNVKKWIESGILNNDGSNIENIPFKETNIYVRKIIQNYNLYKKIYEK